MNFDHTFIHCSMWYEGGGGGSSGRITPSNFFDNQEEFEPNREKREEKFLAKLKNLAMVFIRILFSTFFRFIFSGYCCCC